MKQCTECCVGPVYGTLVRLSVPGATDVTFDSEAERRVREHAVGYGPSVGITSYY